ncbi:uncharacterized protein LOC144445623 [Glandiceps talaboti]
MLMYFLFTILNSDRANMWPRGSPHCITAVMFVFWSQYTLLVQGTYPQYRLVGGQTPFEGMVEIRQKGNNWIKVCDNEWTLAKADIICTNMGLNGAEEVTISTDKFSGNPCIGQDEMATIHCNWISTLKDRSKRSSSKWKRNGNQGNNGQGNRKETTVTATARAAIVSTTEKQESALPTLTVISSELYSELSSIADSVTTSYLPTSETVNPVSEFKTLAQHSSSHISTDFLRSSKITSDFVGITDVAFTGKTRENVHQQSSTVHVSTAEITTNEETAIGYLQEDFETAGTVIGVVVGLLVLVIVLLVVWKRHRIGKHIKKNVPDQPIPLSNITCGDVWDTNVSNGNEDQATISSDGAYYSTIGISTRGNEQNTYNETAIVSDSTGRKSKKSPSSQHAELEEQRDKRTFDEGYVDNVAYEGTKEDGEGFVGNIAYESTGKPGNMTNSNSVIVDGFVDNILYETGEPSGASGFVDNIVYESSGDSPKTVNYETIQI